MSAAGPEIKGGKTSEALTLQQAQSRLRRLEKQNEEMKLELEILRAQNQNRSTSEPSDLAGAEQKNPTEQTFPTEQDLLRCIIDTVADLIYAKDQNGFYRACNKESERFVGLSEAEQIGKTDFDFFPEDLAKTIHEIDRQVLDSGVKHCVDEWVPDPDGKMILLETTKTPFYGPDGKAAGIVGISRDITARKQAEEALKKANRQLADFAHTVAHDLRAPLTPIIGYAELVRDKHGEQLDDQARLYLEEIISAGEEMQLLMKDLLALAVAGKIDRPSHPLKTRDVVTSLLNSLSEQLASAEVSVKVGKLPSVRLPKTLLFQIFENLILNALKYGTKPGDEIEIGGCRDKDRVKFYVLDHGPGISSDERERIFEVFSRGTTAGKQEGTGIGLATVQKIAGLFDGRAWVENTPGGGSTFWIEVSDSSESDTI